MSDRNVAGEQIERERGGGRAVLTTFCWQPYAANPAIARHLKLIAKTQESGDNRDMVNF